MEQIMAQNGKFMYEVTGTKRLWYEVPANLHRVSKRLWYETSKIQPGDTGL